MYLLKIKRKGTVIYTSTSALLVLKAVLQSVQLYKKTCHLAVCSDHNCKHGLLVNHFNLQFYIFPSALVELNPNKRPFVMTRSSFAGTSKYAFKWLGDNGSQWRQLHWSIVGKTEFPKKCVLHEILLFLVRFSVAIKDLFSCLPYFTIIISINK